MYPDAICAFLACALGYGGGNYLERERKTNEDVRRVWRGCRPASRGGVRAHYFPPRRLHFTCHADVFCNTQLQLLSQSCYGVS